MKNLLNKVLLTLIIGNIFIFTEIAQNNISYGKNTLDSEILKCLPKGAKIAVIRDIEGEKLGVKNTDVDGDGEKEVVIAYYTEPHEYTNESFFRRAHVKILKKLVSVLLKFGIVEDGVVNLEVELTYRKWEEV